MQLKSRPVCVVSGASGLVGTSVVPLLARHYDVIALARIRGVEQAGVQWLARDLTVAEFTEGLPAHIDAVVHLAQSRRFREFPEGAQDVLAVNVAATEALARYAAKAGARCFVLTSSGGVYAPSPPPLAETAPLASPAQISWYQASKLAAEALVQSYRDVFVPVVLRPFFIYGAGQPRHMLIPRLCDSVMKGDAVSLAGRDGLQLTPTHVSDAARAVVQSLTLDSPHTINVCGPDAMTIRSICETFGILIGREPVFNHTAETASTFVADSSRMQALLGPSFCHFSEGCASVIEEQLADVMKAGHGALAS